MHIDFNVGLYRTPFNLLLLKGGCAELEGLGGQHSNVPRHHTPISAITYALPLLLGLLAVHEPIITYLETKFTQTASSQKHFIANPTRNRRVLHQISDIVPLFNPCVFTFMSRMCQRLAVRSGIPHTIATIKT